MHHRNMNFVLTKEAARLLDVTPNTVRVLARKGTLATERVGSVQLFDRGVVERLAQQRATARRDGVR